ncbi:hypothetical protein [Solwaraspora sp. WMMD792]|uniref:hypothetical protein n=1 Tax=Solwaraspora sp. WMMD792 TaxID=3016099 RepID=UPI002417772A|nr:hypothetical protein [Solwaraspora sp. WMMD792]MDG4771794.1 hypothetical protein [Solwaraspora sp. WMMD792]
MAPSGPGRRRLAHLVGVADPDGLRERAEAFALTADHDDHDHRSTGPHHATDTTGTVSVTVDDRARVLDVTVARRWRERLPPSAFAEALYEAYVSAVRASFESAALAALRVDAGHRRRNEPAPDDPIPASDEPTPASDDPGWSGGLRATLDRNGATLRRLSRRQTPPAVDEHGVPSPHGYLNLRLRGRGLVGVIGDVRRVAGADAAQLRGDALAAMRAAGLAGHPHQLGR